MAPQYLLQTLWNTFIALFYFQQPWKNESKISITTNQISWKMSSVQTLKYGLSSLKLSWKSLMKQQICNAYLVLHNCNIVKI